MEEFNADVASSSSDVCTAVEDILEQVGIVAKMSQSKHTVSLLRHLIDVDPIS